MPPGAFFITALALMLLESALLTVFGVNSWALSTPIALVIVLGLERTFVEGGLTLLALLFPIEFFISGVSGVYSLALVAVFFFMCALRSQVQLGWGVARGILAFVGGLLHGVMILLLLAVTRQGGEHISSAVAWRFVGLAVVVALVTLLLGRGVTFLDRLINPRRVRRRLEW